MHELSILTFSMSYSINLISYVNLPVREEKRDLFFIFLFFEGERKGIGKT